MFKKIFLLVLVMVLLFSGFVFASRIVDLDGPVDPGGFYINNNHLYVVEKVTVFIYDLKEFKFISKFGKAEKAQKSLWWIRIQM